MDKRAKGTKVKDNDQFANAVREETPEASEISVMVEGLLGVLERHEADANEGVLSLLTALMQAADRLLDVSTPEETAHNREALLGMIDHARKFVETWPHHTPARWRVH
jgi:hypothetical protein